MRYFPMFLDFRGRRVVILGGGEQAAQKARLILRSEAELVVLAPDLNDELATLAAEGRLTHSARDLHALDPAELDAAFVLICASEDAALDAALSARARAAGRVVNVVDRPELCTAITPAIVDRAPLVVAIGSEGVAPVMAQRVKTLAESWLEPSLGPFLAGLAALRPAMAETELAPSPRDFWNWIMDAPRARAEAGDVEGALRQVREAIAAGQAPIAASAGRLTLAELPEAGADLLSLRAVRRLQEADIVFHAPEAPKAALDYARRDAERAAETPLPIARALQAAADGQATVLLVGASDWEAATRAAAEAPLQAEILRAAAFE